MKRSYTFALTLALALSLVAFGSLWRTARAADEPAPAIIGMMIEDFTLPDPNGQAHTPEAFLLDASNKLVYHGRIDNSLNPANVSANDLRDAIDAILAGKPIAKTEAKAFGCSIKRAEWCYVAYYSRSSAVPSAQRCLTIMMSAQSQCAPPMALAAIKRELRRSASAA